MSDYEAKPLPCPFCGSEPEVWPAEPEREGDAWGCVACVYEGCVAQPTVGDGSTVADMRGPGAYKDLAVSRWNRRAIAEGRHVVVEAAELEQLRAEARRYRWLRECDWNTGPLAAVRNPRDAVKLGHDCPSRGRLDEAIDAAQQEQEQ